MSDTNAPEPLFPQNDARNAELSEERLGQVSGGSADGWGYTKGDKWYGMCNTCNKKRDFTCVHTGCEGDFKYTWWQCDECGTIWRWNPGRFWGSWDSTWHGTMQIASRNDPKWGLPSDHGKRYR